MGYYDEYKNNLYTPSNDSGDNANWKEIEKGFKLSNKFLNNIFILSEQIITQDTTIYSGSNISFQTPITDLLNNAQIKLGLYEIIINCKTKRDASYLTPIVTCIMSNTGDANKIIDIDTENNNYMLTVVIANFTNDVVTIKPNELIVELYLKSFYMGG